MVAWAAWLRVLSDRGGGSVKAPGFITYPVCVLVDGGSVHGRRVLLVGPWCFYSFHLNPGEKSMLRSDGDDVHGRALTGGTVLESSVQHFRYTSFRTIAPRGGVLRRL